MKKIYLLIILISIIFTQDIFIEDFSESTLVDWITTVGEGDPYGSVEINNESLRLQSWNNCGQNYSQSSDATLDLPLSDDYIVTFRANKQTWCGHFIFYVLQDDNPGYYRLWWNGSNITSFTKKNIDGSNTTLANNSYNNGTNIWKTYRLLKEGSHLQFLAGSNENNLSLIYDVNDNGEPLNGGNIRFSVHQAGQTTWIDDINIEYIDFSTPQIQIPLDTLNFTIEEDQLLSDSLGIPIHNIGDANLNIDISNNSYWLFSNDELFIPSGDSTILSVWTSGINMEDGNYFGNLILNTNDPENSEIELHVNLIINPGPDPQISILEDSLYFEYIGGFENNSQTITIENLGDDTLIMNLNSGERGSALSFDGVDDWVEFSNEFNFGQGNYTIELWFKSDTLITQDIIALTDSETDLHGILIEPRSDKIRFLHRSPPGSSYTETNVYASVNYNNGNWNHIACIKNQNDIRIYYNGKMYENLQNLEPFVGHQNLILGKLSLTKDERLYNGRLDYIIISGEANYENNFIPNSNFQLDENTVGYWNFNEGSGNVLNDLSGNENHGTINGATWVESPFLQTVEWLSIEDSTIILPPGESSEILVTVNGEDMDWGMYEGFIQIMSNDPFNQIVDIPITMNVLGPEISIAQDSIHFDVVLIDDTLATQTLTIENTGFDSLEVNLNIENYALEFDENEDNVVINNYTNLNLSNQITVEAWIYPTEFYTFNRFITAGSERFVLRLDTGRPQFFIYVEGNLYHAISSIPIPLNEWNHISGIWNGEIGEDNRLKLFVNGNEVNSYAIQHTIEGNLNSASSGNLYLGNAGGESFIGILDEPKIWNRALTEQEIQDRMYRHLNSNVEIGLVGYWSFNEGNGNFVIDNSENFNNCQIINTPTWVINNYNYQNDWLTPSETTLSIPPGESVDIEITANASSYELGDYEGSIQLTTNDPENPGIEIPVNMSVLYPIANIETESIDFGEVGFNSITNLELGITNEGNYFLEVNSAFVNGHSVLSILNDSLTVQPGDTGFVQIQLSTELEEMEIIDTLTIMTNDPSVSFIQIPVSSTIVPNVHPIITSIEDVPNDQGGKVWVTFTRSYHDTDSLRTEQYNVERLVGENWVNVGSSSAYKSSSYISEVTTLLNMNVSEIDTNFNLQSFRVIAGMEEGNFVSEIVHGYSVDNITPAEPVGMTLQYGVNDNQFSMDWQANQDDDLSHYVITQNNEIIATPNISEFDTELNLEMGVHQFTLNAVDVNGNESNAVEKEIYILENELSYGNNLISIPGNLENNSSVNFLESIMETGPNVNFLLGQGVGIFNTAEGWSGNLNNISSHEGYWLNISGSHNLKINPENGALQNCETYNIVYGNNLLSFRWGNGNKPTLEALGGEEFAFDNFNFILGQGQGLFKTGDEWSGNLNELVEGRGYWVNITNSSLDFKWGFDNCANPPVSQNFAKEENVIPEEFKFNQSTEQAFYLIKEIEDIENGDLITAYCGNQLVGSAIWDGEYTVIPVMGRDISEQTIGFCEPNEMPSFVWKKDQGDGEQKLIGEIPGFANLGVYTIDKLESVENVILPTEWSLAPAYPNPFNPVTTIKIGVPEMAESLHVTTLQVFDINGRLINTLIEGNLEAGFHIIEWDATGHPSGLYFVKLQTSEFNQSQKLMLVK